VVTSLGGHQSQLLALGPVVLLLACTFHGTIWTESIADPAENGEFDCLGFETGKDKQSIQLNLVEIRGPLLELFPSTRKDVSISFGAT